MDIERWSRYAWYFFVGFLPFQTAYLLREPLIGGEKWQYGTIGIYGTDILLLLAILLFVIPSPPGADKLREGSAKEKHRFLDNLPDTLTRVIRAGLGMTGWEL